MMTSSEDRRRYPRHPIGIAVRLFLGPEETEQSAEVVDLSGGGMRVRIPGLNVEPDVPLHVYIGCPEGRGATAVARVVRSDEEGIALRFDAIEPGDGDLLGTPGAWASAEVLYVVPIDSQARASIRAFLKKKNQIT